MNTAKIAKNISYVLIPIILIILALSTIGVEIVDNEYETFENDAYILQISQHFLNITKGATPYLIPISIGTLAILVAIIINGIGKNNTNEVILNWFDHWKLEIILAINFIIFVISTIIIKTGINELYDQAYSLLLISIGFTILYLNEIILLETTVKRIKAKMVIKTTLIYVIYNEIRKIIENRNITIKISIFYWAFYFLIFFLTISLTRTYRPPLCLLLLAILGLLTFYKLCKKTIELNKIQKALKGIYEANTNITLNPEEFSGNLKQMAIYINDIAGGLSNAVEQSLKSERLKTELITNVSHDIKTPLTSIINYVDLLKKEKMPNEKTTEYLMILENKSQRLKKLTEDLVEASKASSGNIKLNIEKLNVKELIKQVSGEFEDKFKEKELEEINTFPEENIFINADGRYMYRILENMYSNVAKYALENTRIYVDVVKTHNKVQIKMKNISKQKLNISADELMQRFVRGESSRNTEGSGLGLSIASSLTQLQNGQFNLYLDGDLFKITIEFETVN